ncbi:MAG: hypothetical protein WAN48_08385, partial [Actinomycetes bacterium]
MFDIAVDSSTAVGRVGGVDPLGDLDWAGAESVESVESGESGWIAESAVWLGAWGADLVGVGDDA